MAEKKRVPPGGSKDTTKQGTPAKPAAKRETRTDTAAKAAAKATAKAAPKRAVARPVTRPVARPVERPRAPRAEKPAAAAPKPKAEPRPLPSAPAGQAPLIAADGTVSGSVELPAAIARVKERAGVLFQALTAAAANARQATAATKNRARVSGGGAKPWRQKGTGRARQGSTRAPHWRHGGVVFGPNGRQYAQRIPEKMRRAAFAEALAARATGGRFLVYEGLSFEDDRPRTKTVVDWLSKVGDTGTVVLVTGEIDALTARAAANARDIGVRTAGTLSTEDVLRYDTLVIRRDALAPLAARASVGANGGAA